MEDLSHSLDKRKTTDLLILDFSAAFDTVLHLRLLLKLNHYGITGKKNKWIEAWLCHRQQSSPQRDNLHIFSRLLQSSTRHSVGATDVPVVASDIGDKTISQTTIKLFTGDALLYRANNDPSDEKQFLNDIDTMIEWCKKWLMRSNAKKFHVLNIYQGIGNHFRRNILLTAVT